MLAPFLLALTVASTASTLAPRSTTPIPAALGHYVSDVTWEGADAVLISTNSGVHRYSLRNRGTERLISSAPLPDGVADPEAVSSDGLTVKVTSAIAMGGYTM